MGDTEWIHCYDGHDSTADPQDGGKPIPVWWEDMRPREVRDVVLDTWSRSATAYRRSLIEECCEGAGMTELPLLEGCPTSADCETCPRIGGRMICDLPPIATANVGGLASLAKPAAQWLLNHDPECRCQDWEVCGCGQLPLACAYSDAGGVRTFWLAAGACPQCEGDQRGAAAREALPCCVCNGTGTRADVDAISQRYGGRDGRFEVRL